MKQGKDTKMVATEIALSIYKDSNALKKAMEPKPIDVPLWEIDPDAVNPYAELPKIKSWCKIGERSALPKSGIIAFSAKQKRGKSFATYALAQALLSGEPFDTLTPTERPNYILVFDLEMDTYTIVERVKPIVQRLGEYGRQFVVYALITKTIAERREMIERKVNQYNPDIIIIDHCAMLVNNINDATEAQQICDWLNKLSVNRSVWAVMHENKGAEDTNMRGHVGTNLAHRAVESYSVDRKDGIFTITYREGRRTSPDDATPVRFAIDVNGNIIDANGIAREAQERERDRWRKNFAEIFGNDKTLRSVDMINRIRAKEGLEERWAKTKIKTAKNIGAIRKISNDHNAPFELVLTE